MLTDKILKDAKEAGFNLRIELTGPPGSGKTMLGRKITNMLFLDGHYSNSFDEINGAYVILAKLKNDRLI